MLTECRSASVSAHPPCARRSVETISGAGRSFREDLTGFDAARGNHSSHNRLVLHLHSEGTHFLISPIRLLSART